MSSFLLAPTRNRLFVIDQESAIDLKKPCNSRNRREFQSRNISRLAHQSITQILKKDSKSFHNYPKFSYTPKRSQAGHVAVKIVTFTRKYAQEHPDNSFRSTRSRCA